MSSVPKVFISYAWTSEDHVNKVIDLAQNLASDGIEVIIDKCDLKPGNDKYQFMEQAVTDSTVKYVLLICDQKYALRADKREGGVGDETLLISPEVYNKTNQDKFIPVIFEYDEDNKPYLPAYLKSLLYIDLSASSDYTESYQRLVRHIYDSPQMQKLKIGQKPKWLEVTSETNLSPLMRIVSNLKNDDGSNPRKINMFCDDFQNLFFETLITYAVPCDQIGNGKIILDKITEAKPLRDIYLDFYSTLLYAKDDIVNFTTSFFERFYNEIYKPMERMNKESLEFLLWEHFLCTATLLFKKEYYAELGKILRYSYLFDDSYGNKIDNFVVFRTFCRMLDAYNQSEELNKISIRGHILSTREYINQLRIVDIAMMDIILCQLSFIIFNKNYIKWYPDVYLYFPEEKKVWIKLKSREYCKKVLPLFGCVDISNLQTLILNNPITEEYRSYIMFRQKIPNIISDIKVEEIGTVN